MNCDPKFRNAKHTSHRAGIGWDDTPIGSGDDLAAGRLKRPDFPIGVTKTMPCAQSAVPHAAYSWEKAACLLSGP